MKMNITVENMKAPLGIEIRRPSFGWQFYSEKRKVTQKSYEIKVTMEEGELVWDTKKIFSNQSISVLYEGKPLKPLTRYQVEVTVENNYGEIFRGETWFETAFFSPGQWRASWIVPDQMPAYQEVQAPDLESRRKRRNLDEIVMRPAQYVRRSFYLEKGIKKARVYITAHGVYKMEINGSPVDGQELAPGNSTYPKYLFYQTYDITKFLHQGKNVFGMILGDGWYCGKVGLTGASCSYGDLLAAIFEIHVTDETGDKQIICSDKECLSSAGGPIVYSDLFVGEKYDARLENKFTEELLTEEGWKPVTEMDFKKENLHAQYGEPVRVVKRFPPLKILTTPRGETVIDTGQVVAGRVSMRVKGAAGTAITLEHSEILDNDGNFINNIHGRFSHQTDIYILKGEGEEVYTPSFTYHGFRYIKVSGYPGIPQKKDFEIQVLSSDNEIIVDFTCSDERLNRLQKNVIWSQLGNMLSIPTDCPQREKAGWTGDVQVFCKAAVMNMDVNAFFKRWLMSVRADQKEDGQIPVIVPHYPSYNMDVLHPGAGSQTSAGWGDVIVALPYAMYQAYGDKRVLEENFESMQRWVEYIRTTAESQMPEGVRDMTPERQEWQKYLWNTNFHYGDWLTPSVSVDLEKGTVNMFLSAEATMDIVPTCFYAYSVELLSIISGILNKKSEQMYYRELHSKVKDAFCKEYLDENGMLRTTLQGILVLALQMKLIPEAYIRKNVEKLVDLIRKNENRLDTGFLSIPFLLQILDCYGYNQLSYELLFQEKCPSWLYEVNHGATTIWEAWQAIMPNGEKTNVSYNHYAFGCVAEWMYQKIGGIRLIEAGYKCSLIAPVIDRRLHYAHVSLKTPYGNLSNTWKINGDIMEIEVEIPANTSAVIILPGAANKTVWEDGCEVFTCAYGEDALLQHGSGKYCFRYLWKMEAYHHIS